MLSLAPVEGTQEVSAFVGVHAVNLAGVFLGDVPVLARVGFVKDQKNNVMIKVSQKDGPWCDRQDSVSFAFFRACFSVTACLLPKAVCHLSVLPSLLIF